ncbi:MAG: alanine--tRNA ligase, partial [Alphaproteobacteria bacterium]|nr:alanine--tRNA ligase [Alphaproteobacteria bacterium]
LPKPSIDTGMGLERIACVLQGVHSVFDTDLFRALIAKSEELTKTKAEGDRAPSHNVIADHLRSSCFLIADGVSPSNEGRGYVLRRIMRRAMRHAHLLGVTEPLMWKLVPALVGQMGAAYPELGRAQPLIVETLKLEETRFKQTLDRGLKLLAEETAKLPVKAPLPGEVAFKLYDTYGFPLDLTQDVLKGQGRPVDNAGFDAAMERQRAEARKKWAGSGEAATERVWFELREKLGATEFLGYDTETAEGKVAALVLDGKPVDSAGPGANVAVLVNQTPFYGESGGQMGDAGTIKAAGGAVVTVTDTLKKLGDLHVHLGKVAGGTVKLGDAVELTVDHERRTKLRANHSVTHLLHQALRRRLGGHVTQKGSLVAPDRMRFDISHPKVLTPEDIRVVEADVNHRIRGNGAVETVLMSPEQAVEKGALALFGEKYGEEVRVVSMGDPLDEADGGKHYSTELCGGTHVKRTGDIGLFKIVGESAVAAGVRRIEVLTGQAALDYVNEEESVIARVAAELRAAPSELPARVAALLEERKKLERELAAARKQLAMGGAAGGGAAVEPAARQVAGIAYLARALGDMPAKELKGMADELKRKLGSGVVALASNGDGKASLVVAVTDDLSKRVSAVDLVRIGAAAVGGKGGGGRPDMAQAGGPDADKIDAALSAIEAALAATAKAA